MACMEHECRQCGFGWFDNQRAAFCPHCGGSVTNWWDEANDQREPPDEDNEPLDGYDDEP